MKSMYHLVRVKDSNFGWISLYRATTNGTPIGIEGVLIPENPLPPAHWQVTESARTRSYYKQVANTT